MEVMEMSSIIQTMVVLQASKLDIPHPLSRISGKTFLSFINIDVDLTRVALLRITQSSPLTSQMQETPHLTIIRASSGSMHSFSMEWVSSLRTLQRS
jgi:hypothetical protein